MCWYVARVILVCWRCRSERCTSHLAEVAAENRILVWAHRDALCGGVLGAPTLSKEAADHRPPRANRSGRNQSANAGSNPNSASRLRAARRLRDSRTNEAASFNTEANAHAETNSNAVPRGVPGRASIRRSQSDRQRSAADRPVPNRLPSKEFRKPSGSYIIMFILALCPRQRKRA